MSNTNQSINKKGAVIAVLQILIDLSDEDHYLTYDQIAQELEKRYGIVRARKAIADDIALLDHFGYDIDRAPNGIGVAYLERNLNVNEIQYLVDSLYSSRSVPARKAKDISRKLYEMLSNYQRLDYGFLEKSVSVNHTSNADVFYNIETIQNAIRKKKKIKFQYRRIDSNGKVAKRFNDYFYTINPYYTVNNFGRYYLIGNKEPHNNPSNYRIDYMENIEMIPDSKLRDINEIKELKNVSISQYLSEHIYLFGGQVIDCKMLILNNRVLTDLFDWFGQTARIEHDAQGNVYCNIRCDENALFYWTRQYGERVEVLEPSSLRKRLYEELSLELMRYKPKENNEDGQDD